MTDDLVKRLRDKADRKSPNLHKEMGRIETEAADRIETLQEALREIEMLHYDSEKDFYHDAMKAHHIAVAALGEKTDG